MAKARVWKGCVGRGVPSPVHSMEAQELRRLMLSLERPSFVLCSNAIVMWLSPRCHMPCCLLSCGCHQRVTCHAAYCHVVVTKVSHVMLLIVMWLSPRCHMPCCLLSCGCHQGVTCHAAYCHVVVTKVSHVMLLIVMWLSPRCHMPCCLLSCGCHQGITCHAAYCHVVVTKVSHAMLLMQ